MANENGLTSVCFRARLWPPREIYDTRCCYITAHAIRMPSVSDCSGGDGWIG